MSYWTERKTQVYYQHVYALASFIGRDAESVIDVGSNGCPYLDWFGWIPRRLSVDLRNPYRADHVEGIEADFLKFSPAETFDLGLCLQVLEHIPDAETFAKKLQETARELIVSVPYKWPANHQPKIGHIHDPVDEKKIGAWFGRQPDFQMISTERTGVRRLICYFAHE